MRSISTLVSVVLFGLVCLAQNAPVTAPAGNQVQASVPRLVKLSGTANNPDGQSRTIGITFSIYEDEQGGAALWQEVQNVSLTGTGHYEVVLGSSTSEGVPLEVFASGEARWLGIQVQEQAEQPRTLLVSVPYALKAGDAETLGGRPASSFVTAEQFTSLTANGLQSRSTNKAQLSVANNSILTANVTGSGQPNVLPKFDGSGVNLINSQLSDDGTHVGVGTQSPSGKLEIDSDGGGLSFFKIRDTAPSGDTLIDLSGDGIASGSYFIRAQAADGSGPFAVRGDGSVGIGTLSPHRLLEIGTPGVSSNQIRLSGNGPNGIEFMNYDGTAAVNLFFRTGPQYLSIEDGQSGQTFLNVVKSNGNVGIGTVSPSQRLEVAGTLKLNGQGNGIVFPDGTVQKTASAGTAGIGTLTSVTAGPGLVSSPNPITTTGNIAANLTLSGGDNGSATTVARGDHLHDARYLQISPQVSYSAANLSGNYAFSWTGGVPSNGFVIVVSATGTLQFDGSGHITTGTVQETNSEEVTCFGTLSGTYTVSSSGQGSSVVSVSTNSPGCSNTTASFGIGLTQQGSSLVFAETDNLGWIAGTAIRQ